MDGRPILVVDDDLELLNAIAISLKLHGYPVITARDGEEALRAVAATRPSLVLLDLQMPVLDGCAFARELQNRGFDPPIVIMSASSRDIPGAVREIGARGCLAKPFELARLFAAVEACRVP